MSTHTTKPIDPLAELVRAAVAWAHMTPSIGEAHKELKRAVALYEAATAPAPTAPQPEGDDDDRDDE